MGGPRDKRPKHSHGAITRMRDPGPQNLGGGPYATDSLLTRCRVITVALLR